MSDIYPYDKQCMYCKEPFQGRRNAKFCCPEHKALYHADIKRQDGNQFIETEKKLRKNWKVLKNLFDIHGNSPIDIATLYDQGFYEDVFTGFIEMAGEKHYRLYDHAFKKSKDGIVEILKLKEPG